jgi:hypothetical protein
MCRRNPLQIQAIIAAHFFSFCKRNISNRPKPTFFPREEARFASCEEGHAD